jgi:hypothetical protein
MAVSLHSSSLERHRGVAFLMDVAGKVAEGVKHLPDIL